MQFILYSQKQYIFYVVMSVHVLVYCCCHHCYECMKNQTIPRYLLYAWLFSALVSQHTT